MPLSRDNVNERKLKLIRRGVFRIQQGLERIEWEEKVLYPEIEALKANKGILGLTDGTKFDIEIVHENSDPPTPQKPE